MNKIKKVEKVFKYKLYEIIKVDDCFDNWIYVMFYNGKIKKCSYDFEYLRNIALNDENWKLN